MAGRLGVKLMEGKEPDNFIRWFIAPMVEPQRFDDMERAERFCDNINNYLVKNNYEGNMYEVAEIEESNYRG